MFYVIQENLFKEVHYDMLIECMDRFGFDFKIVKFLPFIHTIVESNESEDEISLDRKDVFCFGAVAMAHAAKKYGWYPGSMMNENHDWDVYSEKFGKENMLNGDGVSMAFTDPLPFDHFLFFARPTRDTKVFSGQVFTKHSWEEYVDHCKENNTANIITDETRVLLAPLKEIQQEIRCWVVGGKCVSMSRYKIGNRVIYQNYDHEEYIREFVEEMAAKFKVAEAYVMDVCLVEDELKIVEINCINCAGFYHCNVQNLIGALEEHFSKLVEIADIN